MKAPHVYFPDSFDTILSTNATINVTNYLAVSGKYNIVRLTGELATLDFDPQSLFDFVVNFEQKKVNILREDECVTFNMTDFNATIQFAKVFNILPFFSQYTGSVIEDGVNLEKFFLSNPLGGANKEYNVTVMF